MTIEQWIDKKMWLKNNTRDLEDVVETSIGTGFVLVLAWLGASTIGYTFVVAPIFGWDMTDDDQAPPFMGMTSFIGIVLIISFIVARCAWVHRQISKQAEFSHLTQTQVFAAQQYGSMSTADQQRCRVALVDLLSRDKGQQKYNDAHDNWVKLVQRVNEKNALEKKLAEPELELDRVQVEVEILDDEISQLKKELQARNLE